MANEEHKTLTPADGDDRNQQSHDQDNDAAGDADAVVQEEAGA